MSKAGASQASLPIDTRQAKWTRPSGKSMCLREPTFGPGSCWYWWEMCPEAERRGCYLHWLKQQPNEVAS
jgi:hypothetical protein